jgi:hypothetical protein
MSFVYFLMTVFLKDMKVVWTIYEKDGEKQEKSVVAECIWLNYIMYLQENVILKLINFNN